MNAVLRVDPQPWRFAMGVTLDFVNARRAITLIGRVVFREIYRDRNVRIPERQMTGLVFLDDSCSTETRKTIGRTSVFHPVSDTRSAWT